MKKNEYQIKRYKKEFIVYGAGGREHTFHKTRKLALNRIINELNGKLIKNKSRRN